MSFEKIELTLKDGRTLSLETGKYAKEAGGAVVVRLGDTIILAAATGATKPRVGIDFFPLLVDFEEKLYAAGRIPGGFFRREGKPSEKSILNARKVDRPIRPLFPEGYINDVQIVVTPLSVDQENPPDVIGIIGASAALSISDVPFEGPIGAVRVGKLDGKFVVNPTLAQMRESSLDIVIAATKDKILMIEAGAEEIPEKEILDAIKEGHGFIKDVISLQEQLMKKVGKQKIKVESQKFDSDIENLVKKSFKSKIEEAMLVKEKGKQMLLMSEIEENIKKQIESDEKLKEKAAKNPGDVKKIIEEIEYDFMRDMILNKGKRLDGRGLKDIREINCEVGVLPRAHGSAVFSRGQTQIMTIATLGAAGD